jgi:hypothetical protein
MLIFYSATTVLCSLTIADLAQECGAHNFTSHLVVSFTIQAIVGDELPVESIAVAITLTHDVLSSCEVGFV